MGQVLRRAGRTTAPPPPVKRPPAPPPPQATDSGRRPSDISAVGQDRLNISDSVLEDASKIKDDSNVLEERDPQYDTMLSNMVGRITTKPGGKHEMGEAFIVERYNRPLPRERSSKSDPEHKPLPPGTLTVTQLQEIIRLYHGKSNEHEGSKDIGQIAEKFAIDTAQVERIVQFVALPSEDEKKNNTDQQ